MLGSRHNHPFSVGFNRNYFCIFLHLYWKGIWFCNIEENQLSFLQIKILKLFPTLSLWKSEVGGFLAGRRILGGLSKVLLVIRLVEKFLFQESSVLWHSFGFPKACPFSSEYQNSGTPVELQGIHCLIFYRYRMQYHKTEKIKNLSIMVMLKDDFVP